MLNIVKKLKQITLQPMLGHKNRIRLSSHQIALKFLSLVIMPGLMLLFAGTVHAQTVTAVQDTTCVAQRASNLTCTAGEFSVSTSFETVGGGPLFCVAGSTLSLNVKVGLSGTNTDRYDIGFFTGQAGNSPRTTLTGTSCSAAIFPTSPSPWNNNDGQTAVGDTCGDFLGGGAATPTVQGIKVLCQAATGSDLTVPYVLSYSQSGSSGQVCNSAGRTGDATVLPGDVSNGAPSKCNAGSAQVTVDGALVKVAGYVDITKQTLPDGDSQSFSFTATGPAGSFLGTSTDGGVTIVRAGGNTVTVNRTDGQTVRIYMSVTATNSTLTIVEAATTNWETSSSISCAAAIGSPVLTTNNSTRTATAGLNTTNSAAACTFTNTKKSRVTIAKSVAGRVNVADQFTVSASAGAGNTLTTDAGGAATSPVSVSTSGAGVSASTIFRSTPGLPLTITDAMASGSVSALSLYATRLTCTNAFAGSGATPNASLPNSLNASTFSLTPAPDDDITCTYTNSPLPLITAVKSVSVNPLVVEGVGLFYTLTITVANAATSAPLTLTDVLPTGITLSSAPSITGGTSTATLSGCPSSGSTTAGCQINTGATVGTIIVRIPVSVAAAAVGANGGNNTANLAGGGDPLCTAVTGQACDPSVNVPVASNVVNITISKTNGQTIATSGGLSNYTITLSNAGPAAADGVVVTDVVGTGLSCPGANVVTCSGATGGAVCPAAPLTIANLTGAGIAVATLPVTGSLQFAYTCNVN